MPLIKILVTINHQSMVIQSKTFIWFHRIKIKNRKLSFIFSSTKRKVSEIVRGLRSFNFIVEGISSDLEQKEREAMLLRFRSRSFIFMEKTKVEP